MHTPFTGRHITVILVAFFAVVIGVNIAMARFAVGTFGGIVVENSYVASQNFNRWLDEARREDALGWRATVSRTPDGHLAVDLDGAPASVTLQGEARHPLGRAPDRALAFITEGKGRFLSSKTLPPGRWTIRLEGHDGSTVWRKEEYVN